MTEDQLILQLRADPTFFERNAFLLAELYLPSPHGNGTVSLAERQQLAQRDKIRVLEAKLAELIQFGEENDAISEKVHRLSVGVLSARNLEALTATVVDNLREDFHVPHVALKLWTAPQQPEDADAKVFAEVTESQRAWAETLHAPYCGPADHVDLSGWFGEIHAPLKSCAVIALRGETLFGVLAMASEDGQRFYPDMGTLYLKRIGELVGVALLRYLMV